MEIELTAVYRKVPEGYIAFVEELPGANTQAETLEAARQNLREAVDLVLEANRQLAEEELADSEVIREPLRTRRSPSSLATVRSTSISPERSAKT